MVFSFVCLPGIAPAPIDGCGKLVGWGAPQGSKSSLTWEAINKGLGRSAMSCVIWVEEECFISPHHWAAEHGTSYGVTQNIWAEGEGQKHLSIPYFCFVSRASKKIRTDILCGKRNKTYTFDDLKEYQSVACQNSTSMWNKDGHKGFHSLENEPWLSSVTLQM